MFFGRSRFHFVFIGAGSSVFTMRLIGDILHEDFIEGGSIRLVDIDEPVLERVTAAVRTGGSMCFRFPKSSSK